ncbi:MAG: hypothetical protein C0594_14810 [Marinilabiliales bacterium]|nr:MAG: hypothetical protein C0594_14810 [Marinilabiliales bacterium]
MDNEKKLVMACIRKEAGSLDALYHMFSSRMFGICLRYAGNRMEAEDLLHDGFIKVLGNLKKFRFEGSFDGWMRRLMVNTAINNYRKKSIRVEQDLDSKETAEIPLESKQDALSELSAGELMELVQNLPEGYRMVFNLYVIEGYKHQEIAQMLDVTESTSKTQLAKARKQLQLAVKNLYHEPAV